MESDILLIVKVLTKNRKAKNTIMENIVPIINTKSYIDDQYDEELQGYILENVYRDINKFKIF